MGMKTALKYLFSVLVTLFFLYFAFRGADLGNLLQILSGANYWWVLASIPPLFISHLFRAWRWDYLLRPVKPKMHFRNLFSAMIVGYMLNNVLPRAGEIARPYAIGKLEGVSRSAAFGTVFMERIFDVLSFMVVIALIPVVYSGPLTQMLPWLWETSIWISAITIVILAGLIFLMIRRDVVVAIAGFFSRFLPKKYAEFVSKIMHSFLDGFLFLKDTKSYAMIIFLSAMVWIFYIIMMYLPFLAFGLTRDHGLDWNAALVIQAISSIGFMMPTPGATGSYHYFVIESMTKLYGIDTDLARSYATVTHAVGFVATMIVGIFFFLKDKLHLSEFSDRGSVAESIGGTIQHGS